MNTTTSPHTQTRRRISAGHLFLITLLMAGQVAAADSEPRISTSGQLQVQLVRTLPHDREVGQAVFVSGFAAVLTVTGSWRSKDGVGHVWDARTGKELGSGPMAVGPTAIALDGKTVFVAFKKEILRYSVPDLKLAGSVTADTEIANLVATSRGVFGCDNQGSRSTGPKPNRNLIDATTGKTVRSFGPVDLEGYGFGTTAVSSDGRRAAACGWHNIYVWDVDTQRQIAKVPRTKFAQQPYRLKFTADGAALIGTQDGLPEVLRLSDAVTTHPANGNFPQVDCPGVHHIPVGLDAAGRHFAIQAGSRVILGDSAALASLGDICMPGEVRVGPSFSSDGKLMLVSCGSTAYVFALERTTK